MGSGGNGAGGVLLIAATNRIDDIDPAVLRRFDRRIYVGLPSAEERVLLLQRKLAGIEVAITDVSFRELSSHLEVRR